MKKLLVLVVVLAMVACANAGIVSNVGGALYGFNEVAPGVVDIVALQANPAPIAFILGSNDGIVTLGAIQAAADNTANNGSWGAFASDVWGFMGATGSLPLNAVLVKDSTLTAGTMTLYSIDENTSEFTAMASYSIPEPITVALLGLGGLFIRRRKA